MLYIESPWVNASKNLALEQYLFEHLPKDQTCFMLWQNLPSVIIGKNQIAEAEVDLEYAREHGINVVRRKSGGGAVYHDMGNINYTYILNGEPGDDLNMKICSKPIIEALSTFGIEASFSGRNDLLVDGRKISGAAEYAKAGRLLHHGTLLYKTDLEVMERVLTVSEEKLSSHGIRSVRSRVTDLYDHMEEKLSTKAFYQELKRRMLLKTNCEVYAWKASEIQEIERIADAEYRSIT